MSHKSLSVGKRPKTFDSQWKIIRCQRRHQQKSPVSQVEFNLNSEISKATFCLTCKNDELNFCLIDRKQDNSWTSLLRWVSCGFNDSDLCFRIYKTRTPQATRPFAIVFDVWPSCECRVLRSVLRGGTWLFKAVLLAFYSHARLFVPFRKASSQTEQTYFTDHVCQLRLIDSSLMEMFESHVCTRLSIVHRR